MEPLSQRAYARHRRCSLAAVQGQIASGHLDEVLVYDDRGHAKISDPDKADALWVARTRPRADQTAAPVSRPPRDPLVITHSLALGSLAWAHFEIVGWTEEAAAELGERAKSFFGMADVDALIDREIADIIENHEDDQA